MVGASIVGSKATRIWNTSLIIMPMEGQSAVMALDMENMMISTGNACSSGVVKHSPVLMAMGLENQANKAIRISRESGLSLDNMQDLQKKIIDLYHK